MNTSNIWTKWLGLGGRAALIGVLAVTLGLALWGQQDTATAATTIVMVGQRADLNAADEFNANTVAITEGDTVQWDWFDGTHNVTPFDPADFTATPITHFTGPGDTYSATFASAGTVWYYCTLHAALSDMDTNSDGVVDGLDSPNFGKMIGSIDVAPAVVDTTGPVTSGVGASPDPTNGAASVTLTATVDDSATGGSSIAAAEYFVDVAGAAGTGTAMAAADASFDSVSEGVTASVDVSALALGSHTLHVRGQDSAGNWGGTQLAAFDVTAVPAGAETMSLQVNGGTLSVSTNPVDFGILSLTGLEQTIDTQPSAWTAADARGTGAGWNVTVSSTDFTSAGGTITVDNSKLRLEDVNVVTVSGNAAPTSQATSYQPLSTSPLAVLSAAVSTGMGTYDFTPDMRQIVPADASPGTYEAFLTVSINSGP
jgi:plastocyanin